MKREFQVHFPAEIWTPLREEIVNNTPREHGAFLLGDYRNGTLSITNRIPEPETAWDIKEELRLKPATTFLNETAAQAYKQAKVPIFLHSHPMGWAGFSGADEHAHDGWAPFFQTQTPTRSFASIVYGMGDWIASVWTPEGRFDTMEVSFS